MRRSHPFAGTSTWRKSKSAPKSVSKSLKSNWRSVKEAVLDPAVEKLQDFTTNLIGIREVLDRHDVGLRKITEYVEKRANPILIRLRECRVDDHLRQALGDLTDVIERITDFVEEQRTIDHASALLSERSFREEVVGLKEELEDAIKVVNDCMMSSLYVRSVEVSELRRSHVPSENPAPSVSTNFSALVRIPKPTQHLVGRTAFIDTIVSSLESGEPSRLAILGPPGIGKTAVGLAVLNHQRVKAKFEGRRIFLNCETIDMASEICTTLSKAIHPNTVDVVTPYAVIGQLQEVHGPKLLVLDNLETAWQGSEQDSVEELLRDITDIADMSLLITMRGTLRPLSVRWSQPLLPQLQPLLLNDSKVMYLSIAQCEDDGRLNELLGLLGGFPLAIELMANLGQQFTPTQLLEAYRRESTAMLKKGRGDTRLTSIEVSIEVSLKSPQMRTNRKAFGLLRALSLLPAGVRYHRLSGGFILHGLCDMPDAVRILVQGALAAKSEGLEDIGDIEPGQMGTVNYSGELITSIEGPVLRVPSPIRDYIQRAYPYTLTEFWDFNDAFVDPMAHSFTKFIPSSRYVEKSIDNFNEVYLHALRTSAASAFDLVRAVVGLISLFDLDRHRELFRMLLKATHDFHSSWSWDQAMVSEWYGMSLYTELKTSRLAIRVLADAQVFYNRFADEYNSEVDPEYKIVDPFPGIRPALPIRPKARLIWVSGLWNWRKRVSWNRNPYGVYASHLRKHSRWFEAGAVFLKGFEVDLEGRTPYHNPITEYWGGYEREAGTIDHLLTATHALAVCIGLANTTAMFPAALETCVVDFLDQIPVSQDQRGWIPRHPEETRLSIHSQVEEGFRKGQQLSAKRREDDGSPQWSWPRDEFVALLLLEPRLMAILGEVSRLSVPASPSSG